MLFTGMCLFVSVIFVLSLIFTRKDIPIQVRDDDSNQPSCVCFSLEWMKEVVAGESDGCCRWLCVYAYVLAPTDGRVV